MYYVGITMSFAGFLLLLVISIFYGVENPPPAGFRIWIAVGTGLLIAGTALSVYHSFPVESLRAQIG